MLADNRDSSEELSNYCAENKICPIKDASCSVGLSPGTDNHQVLIPCCTAVTNQRKEQNAPGKIFILPFLQRAQCDLHESHLHNNHARKFIYLKYLKYLDPSPPST